MPGTLFVVAEDTRRTAKLLAHYGIPTPLASLHAHNEIRTVPALIRKLEAGQSLALVSDAGTPGIADPGEHLVRAAHDRGIRVSPIPGPSAIAAALSASGFPADEFVFMGFVPRSGKERQVWFERLAAEPRTVVFFEVPHRIERTSTDLKTYLVKRQIIVHRELTKIHEESVVWPNMTSRSQGEFVIVAGARAPEESAEQAMGIQDETVRLAIQMFDCLTRDEVFSRDQALVLTATALGVDGRELKTRIKKYRILAIRQNKTAP